MLFVRRIKKEKSVKVVTVFHCGLQCRAISLVSTLRRPCHLGEKPNHSITLGENLKVQSLTGNGVKKKIPTALGENQTFD